ncbi:MAG: hypothetical protein JXB00_03470 [Bacteroidales bacterium]|nr:hypothetical protein [Bacteroidales bacterium]
MNTKIHSQTTLLILTLAYFSSCAPAYVPNVLNTPMLDHQNEFQVSLNTGTAGFDPQIAYTVTDHIGLMANGSFANKTSDSTESFHKHYFIELGAGYYTKVTDNVLFEIYGGFGTGRLKSEFDNELWTSFANVESKRVFLQPSIGVTTEIFDANLASRFTMVNLNQHSASNTGYMWEPAVTFKAGYKHVKTMLQFGFAIPINEQYLEFNYQPFIISFGVQATFGKY